MYICISQAACNEGIHSEHGSAGGIPAHNHSINTHTIYIIMYVLQAAYNEGLYFEHGSAGNSPGQNIRNSSTRRTHIAGRERAVVSVDVSDDDEVCM